jgi:hypothetical protein
MVKQKGQLAGMQGTLVAVLGDVPDPHGPEAMAEDVQGGPVPPGEADAEEAIHAGELGAGAERAATLGHGEVAFQSGEDRRGRRGVGLVRPGARRPVGGRGVRS